MALYEASATRAEKTAKRAAKIGRVKSLLSSRLLEHSQTNAGRSIWLGDPIYRQYLPGPISQLSQPLHQGPTYAAYINWVRRPSS
jgi:hypothetical protein